MRKKYQPTAAETATLTIFLVQEYDREKGRTTTRARVSQQTLRVISARTHLRERFIEDWTEAMEGRGWLAVPIGDHFGIIKIETTNGWVRVSSKRISGTLKKIHEGCTSIIENIEESFEDPAIDEED